MHAYTGPIINGLEKLWTKTFTQVNKKKKENLITFEFELKCKNKNMYSTQH